MTYSKLVGCHLCEWVLALILLTAALGNDILVYVFMCVRVCECLCTCVIFVIVLLCRI